MSWHVIEQFVEGKSDEIDCEDVVVVGEHFVAVIDGATDETGAVFAGRRGGRFAAEVLAGEIASLPRAADARACADRLTEALSQAVAKAAGEPLGADVRWPVASLVCFAPARHEVWRIGDCGFVIDGELHPGTKAVDAAAYGFRAVVNAALVARGVPLAEVLATDPGAEAARPLHDLQQHLANTTGRWGWGCINGRPVPDELIEVIELPRGASQLVLASDGYPVLLPTWAQTEQRLQQLLRTDPAAIDDLWPIGKSFRPGSNAPDDRAYVRISLASA